MIVWSGLGILIAIVAVMAGGLAASVAPGLEHLVLRPDQHVSNALDLCLGAAGAALGCRLLALWLDRRERASERLLVDATTGQQVRFVRRDTLFFMRARTWVYLLLAFSALGLVEFAVEAIGRAG